MLNCRTFVLLRIDYLATIFFIPFIYIVCPQSKQWVQGGSYRGRSGLTAHPGSFYFRSALFHGIIILIFSWILFLYMIHLEEKTKNRAAHNNNLFPMTVMRNIFSTQPFAFEFTISAEKLIVSFPSYASFLLLSVKQEKKKLKEEHGSIWFHFKSIHFCYNSLELFILFQRNLNWFMDAILFFYFIKDFTFFSSSKSCELFL